MPFLEMSYINLKEKNFSYNSTLYESSTDSIYKYIYIYTR